MNTIVNILWLCIYGLAMALAFFLVGILCCITIIFIPWGRCCFRIAHLAAWPSGTKVEINFHKRPIRNFLWLLFIGVTLSMGFFVAGVSLSCTIIGMPFGMQFFKLAKLCAAPFGATVG